MGSLLDEIGARLPRAKHTCGVATLLAALPPEDAADLATAMAGSYQHTVISRVLKDRGHDLAPSTISRHRRRECLCPA